MIPASVVAITELAGAIEAAAPELAADLGTTAYELRLTLAAGMPAVVLLTQDSARAAAVYAAIVRRGHRAVSCSRADVVASAGMTALRDFRFEGGSLVAASALPNLLPFSDILALFRASHRTTTETTTEVKERKLRPGMALATGGLVISKTTTREVTQRSEAREQVLYVFRRSGEKPWILREREARYGGLGASAGRTSLENFATTVRLLRELSPTALYDERLVGTRPVRGLPDPIASVDLLAHVLARSAASVRLGQDAV